MMPDKPGYCSKVVKMGMGDDDEVNTVTNKKISGRESLHLEVSISGN